ncbi:hypothetical protein E1B28_004796 [Marasmius oreades]|uniref:VWFA domain-containing protein n=1 Tax=Marasmius oreades TaxID=181124 RepID=A0A9P8AD68_9AGAR|nr:uncharacterized protein E1B28_004796 [Marasmius oreades]KAG7097451.1 hypothetical protein E1B28_004796 [Marasmius oreades]
MGNSPSSSRHNSISKPQPLSRRRSTRENQGSNFLGTPNPTSTSHRRSRSANAALSRRSGNPDIVRNPPPPYSRTPPPESRGFMREPYSSSHSSVSLSHSTSSESSSGRHRNRSTYLRTPMRQQTRDDMLVTLRKYDTVIIVDDSSSMIGERWNEASKALSELASLAGQFDADGIDIYFLNDERVGLGMRRREAVDQLFKEVRPKGVTPIGERLETLLRGYLARLESANDSGSTAALKSIKPINYIIITDGAPTDDPESVIVQAARRLDAKHFPVNQIGIQFVQIGKSASAARYLQELDDNLVTKHNLQRDIVDTTKYFGMGLSADALVKILLGGINRRVDNDGTAVFDEDLSPKTPVLRVQGLF